MTTNHKLPSLNTSALEDTRDACHAYANVLGNWMASCRLRRKHWWQLSLRPTLRGVATGMVHADGVHFELELDLQNNQVQGEIAGGESFSQSLGKQTAAELAEDVRGFLLAGGVDPRFVPDTTPQEGHDALSGEVKDGYSAEIAREFAAVWREVSHAYAIFRAGIPEETSPIMVWPGHFDLCMMWIPGQKIPDQDPENEEYSDKQMNFGFSLGDEGIPEPYFYITAYPLPDAFPTLKLPAGATWYTEGFNGVVLRYETLQKSPEAQTELVGLLKFLVTRGREHMLEH
ncbi:MAG TPA: hypothetical protein EYQ14_25145 [Gammaproteobacteria bacterium]|nr:hypothetical protein [Gammaproteobacteria bacterium]